MMGQLLEGTSSDMANNRPISREVVTEVVKLYGQAWVNQDTSILPSIFSKDAIYIGKLFTCHLIYQFYSASSFLHHIYYYYIERAYDTKATFKGLKAIEDYWNYQIVGKQSNIQFRHVESEMVRDIDNPIAVVKWLAEFDNRRENRVGESSDKTYKRVRYVHILCYTYMI